MRMLLWALGAGLTVIASLPLALLPHRMSLKAGELLGLSLFRLWKSRRVIATDNVEKAVAQGALAIAKKPEAVARASFAHLGRSFAEVVKVYFGRGDKSMRSVEIRGLEHYRKASEKQRGVMFVTGHCGNWELLALVCGVRVSPISVVARRQNNPYLNRLLERARGRFGNRVIYKQGALRGIVSELKKGGTVGILMDQAVVAEEGIIIDFLGRPAWTTKVPALIARKTGAAAIPAFIHREGPGRHVVTVYPEIELSRSADSDEALVQDTKEFSSRIEKHIQDHPEQWLWMHRRWKRA